MTNVPKLAGITLPGTGYPKLINFSPPSFPDAAGSLVGLYVFGGDGAAGLYNFANPDLPLLPVLTPTVADIGATVGNALGYFDTQLASPAALSIIAVAKPLVTTTAAATFGVIAGDYNSGTGPAGDFLGFANVSSNPSITAIGQGGQRSDIQMPSVDTSKWNGFGARIKSTGETKAYRSFGGAVTQGTESAAATRAIPARTLRVGYDYGPQFLANVPVALVAVFNAALTDANFANDFACLRTVWGPALGITTL